MHATLALTPKWKHHVFVPHLVTSTQNAHAFLLKPTLKLPQFLLKDALALPPKWLTLKQRQCQTLLMLLVVWVMNFALKFLACLQSLSSALLRRRGSRH